MRLEKKDIRWVIVFICHVKYNIAYLLTSQQEGQEKDHFSRPYENKDKIKSPCNLKIILSTITQTHTHAHRINLKGRIQ